MLQGIYPLQINRADSQLADLRPWRERGQHNQRHIRINVSFKTFLFSVAVSQLLHWSHSRRERYITIANKLANVDSDDTRKRIA